MHEIVIGHLLFLPGFVGVCVTALIAWLCLRKVLARLLNTFFDWNTGWVEMGLLSVCLYASHTLFILLGR